METYNTYDEELKRKRIDAAKEEIKSAKRKIAKMEQKIDFFEEEEIEELDKREIAERYLGLILLPIVGLYVLYRYLVFGFI